MSLYTVFGINGVGKDTVLNAVKEQDPAARIISETKLLMFGLGILKAYDESVSPGRDEYLELEHVPQPVISQIEKQFPDILSVEARSANPTLMTSHLIPAQLLLGEVVYLVKPKPPCLHQLSRTLIQITASPETVLARRTGDERDRGQLGISEVVRHQVLCDQEWERLQGEATGSNSSARFVSIVNEDLPSTVQTVYNLTHEEELHG